MRERERDESGEDAMELGRKYILPECQFSKYEESRGWVLIADGTCRIVGVLVVHWPCSRSTSRQEQHV